MYIARILYPVKVLGPGKRIGIWTAGCRHMCEGCCSPELWYADRKYSATVDQVCELIGLIVRRYQVDGFTVTGGDPMEQADEMSCLLERVRSISEDVMLYTGYCLEELTSESQKKLLDRTAVLIDGKYEKHLNNHTFLRGSSNQRIHILKPEYREKYMDYISRSTNEMQNFIINHQVVSVGIPCREFVRQIRQEPQISV